jgi:hypothetical protein
MTPFRFFHSQLFKLSLLVTLLMILFLLNGSFILSPDLPRFSNMIQSVSFIISSPYLLLEKMTGVELGWSPTALIIFFFWFAFIYTVLIVLHNFFNRQEVENS